MTEQEYIFSPQPVNHQSAAEISEKGTKCDQIPEKYHLSPVHAEGILCKKAEYGLAGSGEKAEEKDIRAKREKATFADNMKY